MTQFRVIDDFARCATLEQELSERNRQLAEMKAALLENQSQRAGEAVEAQARIAELMEINAQVFSRYKRR